MLNNATTIGLSVTTAVLAVGMFLLAVLVFVLVMVIKFLRVEKAKNNSEIILKGNNIMLQRISYIYIYTQR